MTHIKTNQVESLEVSFNRGFISFLENKSCILYIYMYTSIFSGYVFWIIYPWAAEFSKYVSHVFFS